MPSIKKEFWVGLLVVGTFLCLGLFAWLLGGMRPLGATGTLNVIYEFAAGIEVGSPVRLAGVKIGTVDEVQFINPKESSRPVVQVSLALKPEAWTLMREDSQFFINMAGIIGERYIEITPGSYDKAQLKEGSSVRGMDPPRLDQLLSQGYGFFGKLEEFLLKNEATAKEFLDQISLLLTDANKVLGRRDWKKMSELVHNLNEMTQELRVVTSRLRSPQAQEVLDKLSDLVDRSHSIDKKSLEKFLQEEGIRARIF